jgi:hypothetical protein
VPVAEFRWQAGLVQGKVAASGAPSLTGSY